MAILKSLNIDGDLILDKGTGTASGTTVAVDLATGNHFEVDLQNASGDITTFTITEALAGTQVQTFFLKITQGAPARQFNWNGLTAFKWPGGSFYAPPLYTINNAVSIYSFFTMDLGTTWYVKIVGINFN